MSASHSHPMGAGRFEPCFCDRDRDDAGVLTRAIRALLDERGPLPFSCLYPLVNQHTSIAPATLHDHLNNLLSAGLVTLAPTGFYLVA